MLEPTDDLTPLPDKLKLVADLQETIHEGYKGDPLFAKIIAHPEDHSGFIEESGFI